MLKASGYQHTLVLFGTIFAAIGLLGALMLRAPPEEQIAGPAVAKPTGYAPIAMLGTPVFWLMFVMMSMMSTGGLMVITQFTSFASRSASTPRPRS